KVAVPALGGEHVMTLAVPVQSALAQSRAGGDQRLISRDAGSLVQSNNILGGESANAPSRRFEVVDQKSVVDFEFVGKAPRLDRPGKIGSYNLAVCYWAGHAEAGLRRMCPGGLYKLADDFIEARIISAGKNGRGYKIELLVTHIEQRQPRVGAPDVACQDHLS